MRRRAFLASVGTGLIGTAGCVSIGGASTIEPGDTTSFPSFQFDPQNSGYAPDRTGPRSKPEAGWEFPTDSDSAVAPPIVYQELVITKTEQSVYGLDAATGQLEWDVSISSTHTAPPTLGSERLFVPTDEGVLALDPTDGSELWRSTAPTSYPPVVDGDRVISVGQHGNAEIYSIADGRTQADPNLGDDLAGIAVSEEGVICALGDEALYITDDLAGDYYTLSIDGRPRAPPTIVGSTVYATAQGSDDPGLHVIDMENHETLQEISGEMAVSVASATGSTVLGSGGPVGDYLVAFDTSRQDQPVWSTQLAGTITSPLVTRNAAFVGTRPGPDDDVGTIEAVGPHAGLSWEQSNGEPNSLWTYEVSGGIASQPAVTESALYFADETGSLHGIGASAD